MIVCTLRSVFKAFALLGTLVPFLINCSHARQSSTFTAPELYAFITANGILLEWTNVEGEERFYLERKVGDDSWQQLGIFPADTMTYRDLDTFPGITYRYRISAANSLYGTGYSNEVSVTTAGSPPPPPSGTPVLYADAISHALVVLKWSDLEGETQYRIERQNESGQWIEIGVVGGGSANFHDTELKPQTLYHYRVRGWNHAGFSLYSNQSAATTFSTPEDLPATPRLFSFYQTDTTIELRWDAVPGATGYHLQARPQGADGTWRQIADLPAAVTVFLHDNLTHSTPYWYRVRAYNATDVSYYSEVWQSATLPPPPPSPELQATARSYNEIELSWKDVLDVCCTANGFIGYRLGLQEGDQWKELTFAGVDQTSHLVTKLQPSTQYSFRIIALNPLASDSSQAIITTLNPPPVPPPIAPSVYADAESSTSIRVKWVDVELETEYRIERKNSSGQWESIATLPANSLFYIDSGLQPSTPYAYRVLAANSYGVSPHSNEAGATTQPSPPPAISFRSIAVAQDKATLHVAGPIGTKFKIQSSFNFSTWSDVTPTVTLNGELTIPLTINPGADVLFYRTINEE